jgi:Cu+-exporting ATPase
LRDDSLISPQTDEIHTVVFDKTGTLTTGNSQVASSDIPISSSLWQRIYLLEKAYGREHPLAKAIQKYYDLSINHPVLFSEVTAFERDTQRRGFSAKVQGRTLHIGSFDYLKDCGIDLPEPEKSKIEQGLSTVCVAEDGVYKGVVYIKHEVRSGVLEALTKLKKKAKIIMLTGDNLMSSEGFNKQMGSIFEEEDIHAGQTPQDKETFFEKLFDPKGTESINPKGVWFVGDGLNDAPCCRIVSEQGGVSCAMDSNDKSAFFTDITLNGSLDYLFKHHELNESLHQNINQNKDVITYSTVAFLAFILSFSIAGIAVSPLIPMAIMLSTTLFVLFNSYRIQLNMDTTLDKESPWYKKLASSNVSVGLLLTASTLLIGATLVSTIATGGLALPVTAFASGVALALSSASTLSALALLSVFAGIVSASFMAEDTSSKPCENSSRGNRLTNEGSNLERADTTAIKPTPTAHLFRPLKTEDRTFIEPLVNSKEHSSPSTT